MNAKKTWLLAFSLSAMGMFGLTSVAPAAISVGDVVQLNRVNHNGGAALHSGLYAKATDGTTDLFNTRGGANGGGEFRVNEVGGDGPNYYKSFCLEINETIGLGVNYVVETIADYAERGGNDSNIPGDNKDYLSNATEWLYGSYRTSTLDTDVAGFDYNSATWINALQDAIWSLEEEIGAVSGNALTLKNWALGKSGNFNLQGRGTVLVLNIMDNSKNDKQSQLFYTPDNIEREDVPEPMSLAIWGGLAGIGLAVGKFRRRSAKA